MATSEKLTRFRLATINVHSFRRPSNRRAINIDDLVSILKPLNLNLIAVQEVQNNYHWKKFCQDMSLPYSVYGTYSGIIAEVAIASSYPITSHSYQQSTLICQGGWRYFLQCSLDDLHKLTFGVTHLDHQDEDNRLTQINQFKPNIDILMGDINALTREDYSENYYQDIVLGKREKSGWEKPRFDLTKLIRDEWGYQDAFRSFNPQLKDEQVTTCRFGTRIDYIYVHPRVYDQWKLTKCEIIDTKEATDHNIVFAEFELK
jgi:exonuclease III